MARCARAPFPPPPPLHNPPPTAHRPPARHGRPRAAAGLHRRAASGRTELDAGWAGLNRENGGALRARTPRTNSDDGALGPLGLDVAVRCGARVYGGVVCLSWYVLSLGRGRIAAVPSAAAFFSNFTECTTIREDVVGCPRRLRAPPPPAVRGTGRAGLGGCSPGRRVSAPPDGGARLPSLAGWIFTGSASRYITAARAREGCAAHGSRRGGSRRADCSKACVAKLLRSGE